MDANFKRVDTILAKYRTKTGFETYDKLINADRNAERRLPPRRKISPCCVACWVWTKHDEQA